MSRGTVKTPSVKFLGTGPNYALSYLLWHWFYLLFSQEDGPDVKIFPRTWSLTFPKICACTNLIDLWQYIIFSCPWYSTEHCLKELTSVNLSVWVGTLFTENRNHFWTTKSNYYLLTFEILQNTSLLLKNKIKLTPYIV